MHIASGDKRKQQVSKHFLTGCLIHLLSTNTPNWSSLKVKWYTATWYAASAKFVLESKLRNRAFGKMSNVAIYQISVAQNINFNSKRGFKDTKNYKKCLKWLIKWFFRQSYSIVLFPHFHFCK